MTLIEAYLKEHPAYRALLQYMNMPARLAFVTLQISEHGWQPPEKVLDERKHRYDEAHQYRDPINNAWRKAAHKLAGTFPPYPGNLSEEEKHRWEKAQNLLGKEAKRFAGQPDDRKLREIQSLDALEAMLVFFEQKIAE